MSEEKTSTNLLLGIIIGFVFLLLMFLYEIGEELKHTKKLLHLQNSITNQVLIEITNMRKDRK